MAESPGTAEDDWGELDGDEEPLFADDIDYEDDLPPLPPPMPSQLSQVANNHTAGALRVNANSEENFGGGDGTANADGTAGDNAAGSAQKKRKPLLTLTPDRIFSEKGLPYLEREFPKLKFKGKGHEASDLKNLLQQYEHWANRLFPKLTFKDVTDRIESLASKKEFKSQLVRMRRRSIRGGASPSLSDDEDNPELQIPPTVSPPPGDNNNIHPEERTGDQEYPNLWDVPVTNGNNDGDGVLLNEHGNGDSSDDGDSPLESPNARKLHPSKKVSSGDVDREVLLGSDDGDSLLESPNARHHSKKISSGELLDKMSSDGGDSPTQSPRTQRNMEDQCTISGNVPRENDSNGVPADNPALCEGTNSWQREEVVSSGRGRKRRLSSSDDDQTT